MEIKMTEYDMLTRGFLIEIYFIYTMNSRQVISDFLFTFITYKLQHTVRVSTVS